MHLLLAVLGWLLIVLVAGSGVMKLLDWDAFAAGVRAYDAVPGWAQTLAISAVPPAEVAIAIVAVASGRRTALWCLSGLLAALTGVLIYQVSLSSLPDCGCAGLIIAHNDAMASGEAAIVRNLVLLGVIGICLCYGYGSQRRSSNSDTPIPSQAYGPAVEAGLPLHADRRGFTLLETILVIAIIGLLIALLLAPLSTVRESARQLSTSAKLRDNARAITGYSAGYSDAFPATHEPRADEAYFYWNGRATPVRGYFWQQTLWHWPLIGEQGAVAGAGPMTMFSPQLDSDLSSSPEFDYAFALTPTVFAAPDYWRPETRRGDRSQWKVQTFALVRSPSAKSMLVDVHGWPGPRSPLRRGVAFMDGSVEVVTLGEGRAPCPGGEGGPSSPSASIGYDLKHIQHFHSRRYLHTLGGVQGRDHPGR